MLKILTVVDKLAVSINGMNESEISRKLAVLTVLTNNNRRDVLSSNAGTKMKGKARKSVDDRWRHRIVPSDWSVLIDSRIASSSWSSSSSSSPPLWLAEALERAAVRMSPNVKRNVTAGSTWHFLLSVLLFFLSFSFHLFLALYLLFSHWRRRWRIWLPMVGWRSG